MSKLNNTSNKELVRELENKEIKDIIHKEMLGNERESKIALMKLKIKNGMFKLDDFEIRNITKFSINKSSADNYTELNLTLNIKDLY